MLKSPLIVDSMDKCKFMFSFKYKNYVLFLLTLIAAFNYLDRGLMALAMESIKLEFSLTDSQLGLMSGFAFSLFYAIAGIPIARWADRGNRNSVITITTALWSLMLAVCASVTSFSQLLLARVGVAIGESGCIPPAQSLISDYFDRAERPQAMAVYWISSPLAIILSYLGGGWLIDNYGWRFTFLIVGAPGLLLAVLVKYSLKEPRLNNSRYLDCRENTDQEPIAHVMKSLWNLRSFRNVVLVFNIAFFFGAGIIVWVPTFFIRSYDMNATEVGVWLAFTWGFVGMMATLLGGWCTTRYAARKESLQMKTVAGVIALCTIVYSIGYLSDSKYVSLACISLVVGGLIPMIQAPIYSAIQSLVYHRMRSFALAFIFMLANLIGLGLGPLAVGVISDLLSNSYGSESLRYALLVFSPGYLWCASYAWRAAYDIEEDIREVEVSDKRPLSESEKTHMFTFSKEMRSK